MTEPLTDIRTVYFPADDDGHPDSWQVQAGEYADEPDLVILIDHAVDSEGHDIREQVARAVAASIPLDCGGHDVACRAAQDDAYVVGRREGEAAERARIARDIHQVWGIRDARLKHHWTEYSSGYLDGLEHAQRIAETAPEEPGRCKAHRDGECHWTGCPQVRDGEPRATGRHCPLDNRTAPEEES